MKRKKRLYPPQRGHSHSRGVVCSNYARVDYVVPSKFIQAILDKQPKKKVRRKYKKLLRIADIQEIISLRDRMA